MYPFAPSIPSLFVGHWTHFENAETCGSYSEATLGLETDSLVSSSILSKGILGIGNRQLGQVSRTKTIRGLGTWVIIKIKKSKFSCWFVLLQANGGGYGQGQA